MIETFLPATRGPAPATPPRAPGSIRRTATIDTSWPDGRAAPMLQRGHARDLVTAAGGTPPLTIAEDRFTARLTPRREILEIDSDPPRAGIARLVGARAGGQLRDAIDAALPGERERGSPLYLLLDDIAGSSLVAPWAWSLWIPEWREIAEKLSEQGKARDMTGVCIGFRPGSPALDRSRTGVQQNNRPVEALDATDDPSAWHRLEPQSDMSARRARRIDVRLTADEILVDAHFQDSASSASGQRWAVHEYLVTATADRETLALTSIVADPRVLPFDQCPAAIGNIGRMIGTPLPTLRRTVLRELARTEGCTHLNDMLRSLAEVPQLAAALTGSARDAA